MLHLYRPSEESSVKRTWLISTWGMLLWVPAPPQSGLRTGNCSGPVELPSVAFLQWLVDPHAEGMSAFVGCDAGQGPVQCQVINGRCGTRGEGSSSAPACPLTVPSWCCPALVCLLWL